MNQTIVTWTVRETDMALLRTIVMVLYAMGTRKSSITGEEITDLAKHLDRITHLLMMQPGYAKKGSHDDDISTPTTG